MAKTTETRLRKVFEETGLTKEALEIILPKIESRGSIEKGWAYIFRLWCGLVGEPPLTLEKIGGTLDICHQRVHQKVRRVFRILKDPTWDGYRPK